MRTDEYEAADNIVKGLEYQWGAVPRWAQRAIVVKLFLYVLTDLDTQYERPPHFDSGSVGIPSGYYEAFMKHLNGALKRASQNRDPSVDEMGDTELFQKVMDDLAWRWISLREQQEQQENREEHNGKSG